MRGREHLFHTRCFSCHVCQTHLVKGSTFGMVGALIFCQQHYLLQQQQEQQQQEAICNNDQLGHHQLASPPFHHPHSLLQHHQQQVETGGGGGGYLMGHHHHHPHHLNQEPPFNSPHHYQGYDQMQQQQQPPYGQVMMQQQQQQQQSLLEPTELPTVGGKLFGSATAAPLKSPRVRTKRRPVTVPTTAATTTTSINHKTEHLMIGKSHFIASILTLSLIVFFSNRTRWWFVHVGWRVARFFIVVDAQRLRRIGSTAIAVVIPTTEDETSANVVQAPPAAHAQIVFRNQSQSRRQGSQAALAEDDPLETCPSGKKRQSELSNCLIFKSEA